MAYAPGAVKLPTIDDVRAAAERVAPYAHRTPVLTSRAIDAVAGRQLFFKCECFQRAGAFKFRGACNTVFSLSEADLARGVATHSSGNHGAALALAASLRGVAAQIVTPRTTGAVKIAAVEGYGGKITLCEPTLAARESTLAALVAETGSAFVHSYNDPRVIAGQGTAALELLVQQPRLDLLMAPVGGGGLISGTALVARQAGIPVIAGEPAGADDACRSLQAGELIPSTNPNTIADGLLTSLGELSFAIIKEGVERIIAVTDEQIIAAMRLVWQRMRIIIEPSSAVPLAAVLAEPPPAERIGIILTGGNVDLDRLPFCPDR